jgi:hypothetical protein
VPSHKPPKYIYQVKYHPTAVPTFDEGFRDHAHANEFDNLAMNDMELFRFKYLFVIMSDIQDNGGILETSFQNC